MNKPFDYILQSYNGFIDSKRASRTGGTARLRKEGDGG